MDEQTSNSYLAEKILTKSIEFQSVLDAFRQKVAIIDRNFAVLRANNQAIFSGGHRGLGQTVGRPCYEILYRREEKCAYCPFPDNREHILQPGALFSRRKSWEREISVAPRNKAGMERFYSIKIFPIREQDDSVSVVEMVEDITRHKNRQINETRRQKLGLLGQMVSGIAHELNNPLTGLALSVQNLRKILRPLIEGDNASATIRAHAIEALPDNAALRGTTGLAAAGQALNILRMMENDITRSRQIIDDILHFARPREKLFIETDLALTVVRAIDIVRRNYPTLVNGVNVRFNAGGTRPAVGVFTPNKIERAIINIMHNSLQALFSRPEPRNIALRLFVTRRMLHLKIMDNGPGIDADNIAKIFDPFFTTKGQSQGTGLGLTIAYGIMQEHDGQLTVKSKPGRTIFFMSLPKNPRAG